MLQAIVSVFAGIAGLASFYGFVFLSRYYEAFGVGFQYLDPNPNHLLFRGLYLLYTDSICISIAIIFSLMVFFTIGIKGINLGSKVIGRRSLVIAAAVGCGFGVFLRAEAQASNFANRDKNVTSTALRQLICVSENQVSLFEFLRDSHAANRKVLILVWQNQRIIIFSAPENPIGRREVQLYETTLSDEAIVGHHHARFNILPNSQLTCTR